MPQAALAGVRQVRWQVGGVGLPAPQQLWAFLTRWPSFPVWSPLPTPLLLALVRLEFPASQLVSQALWEG